MELLAIRYQCYLLRRHLLCAIILLMGFSFSYSQSKIDSLLGKLDPQRYAAIIGKKTDKMEELLVKKSVKVLSSMQKQEEKVYKKMLKGKDSLMARAKLAEMKEKYSAMKAGLRDPAMVKGKQYIPNLDSLSTSLKFLDANGVGGKVKDALGKTNVLQDKFQQAEQLKQFIKQRREQLKAQLEKLGMMKQLKQINKQVYYYSAQIKEYKEILKDPKKIEKKAMELLAKNKRFQQFMAKNSMLASMFRMPGNENNNGYTASLAGLQTRAQVNSLIQQQIQTAGPNGMQQFQQQMQSAQAQLNQLKTKLAQFGSGNSNDEMPQGFKPNDQKTKNLLKRLELGTTMQTQRATNYFPTTTDMGLTLGYKPNNKSVIGIGMGYKLGLGRGWDHIRFTSEGMSLKSFIDLKMKGNFWLSGGYELHYRTAFRDFANLKNMSGWQRSGLLGLSKSVPIKTKFFKKTKVSVLWDFLSKEQRPIGQAINVRFGYNF